MADDYDYSAYGEGAIVYRASSLGSCIKSQVAKRLGYEALPYPNFFQTIFREGHLHEQEVRASLVLDGHSVSCEEEEVSIYVRQGTDRQAGIYVVGHIDNVVDGRVIDIKTVSQDVYLSVVKKGWDAPGLVQKYKWQLSVGMIAKGMQGALLFKNRNNGQKHWLYAEKPFYSFDDIVARVNEIESWVEQDELPVVCNDPSWPCPFSYLHEDEEESPEEEIPNDDLQVAVEEYRNAKINLLAATKAESLARDKVKVLMLEFPGKRKSTEDWTITKYQSKGRAKVDYAKMIEDYSIDVEQYTTRPDENGKVENIRITLKGLDDESD